MNLDSYWHIHTQPLKVRFACQLDASVGNRDRAKNWIFDENIHIHDLLKCKLTHSKTFFGLAKIQNIDKNLNQLLQLGLMDMIDIMSNMCQRHEVQKPKKMQNHHYQNIDIDNNWVRVFYYYLKAKLQQNPLKLTLKYRFILSQIQLTPKWHWNYQFEFG